MRENAEPRRWTIQSHTGPRAISRQIQRALEALGYNVVPANGTTGYNGGISKPALWLIDERNFEENPNLQRDPHTPVVLLTGSRHKAWDDQRIVARVRRPAQLRELYRSFQSALEPTPRQVPRVATQIPARCIRSDHRWPGAIVSLSEGGCLMRVSEQFAQGTRINLQFAIPKDGILTTRAECRYRSEAGVGLVFPENSERNRQVINNFVVTCLAALAPATRTDDSSREH